MKKAKTISLSATVTADPASAFRALTDSKIISQWSGQKGIVEPKIGGKFEMFDKWVEGKVLAYQTGKVLSYTWHTAEWDEDIEPSIVRIAFAKAKTGTKISLKHTGLPNEKERREHHGGWKKHVFDPLREYFGASKTRE